MVLITKCFLSGYKPNSFQKKLDFIEIVDDPFLIRTHFFYKRIGPLVETLTFAL